MLGYLSRLAKTSALEAVLEPSGTYGDGLIWQLRQLGLVVYRVSPKRVHDVAEVYDGVPSLHDAKAAELIGRLHLQGVSQVWEARGEVSKARRQRQLNRLEAHLSRHWPEVLALLDLGSVTLGELVAAYGSPAAVAADLQGAQMLMCRVGRVGLSQETVAAVLASSGTSLGLPCVGAESGLLQWLAADSNVYPSFLAAISASSWRGTSGLSIGYRMKE